MIGKIAIEEHFATPALAGLISGVGWSANEWQRVLDRLCDTELRLSEMDRLGIEMAVLSLGSFGIQDVVEARDAVASAVAANDALAAAVAAHPDRFAGFAALPMQDPSAALQELQRAVGELGFKGALVNGYSSVGDLDTAAYYDDERYLEFWHGVEQLGVPFYLHPRNPLPSQRRIYEGRSELLGPTWAFAVETGSHALRLITSGLFDRCPRLQVIVGHLGEFLPFALPRLQQRMAHLPHVKLDRPATQYLRENFHITTSGNNHTASLIGVLLEVGADRLLFAADYPFEEMADGATWFDSVAISENDRLKIGRTNAQRLLGL
jgi:predicted TIM-barrel fold metal-dependent hydrolase